MTLSIFFAISFRLKKAISFWKGIKDFRAKTNQLINVKLTGFFQKKKKKIRILITVDWSFLHQNTTQNHNHGVKS